MHDLVSSPIYNLQMHLIQDQLPQKLNLQVNWDLQEYSDRF